MQWVYILRCEKKVIYVGETKNLYSRMFQHTSGGCSTTKKYRPLELIGLYKVTSNYNFLKYIKEIYNDDIELDDKIENVVKQIWLQSKNSIIQRYGQEFYERIKMEMKQTIKHEFF